MSAFEKSGNCWTRFVERVSAGLLITVEERVLIIPSIQLFKKMLKTVQPICTFIKTMDMRRRGTHWFYCVKNLACLQLSSVSIRVYCTLLRTQPPPTSPLVLPQVVYHVITIKVTVLSKSNTLQQTQSLVGILVFFRTYDEDHRGPGQTDACLSPVVNCGWARLNHKGSVVWFLLSGYMRLQSEQPLGPFSFGTADLSLPDLSTPLVRKENVSTQEAANKSLF